MIKSRIVAILVGVVVVIAAIVVVALKWPELPERTTVAPMKVPPPANCMVRGRNLRLEDKRWTDYTSEADDPHHATIVLDVDGGRWSDAMLPQSLALTAAELQHLDAALAASCEVDASRERNGYEGRYILVDGKQKLLYNSPISVRVGIVFDEIRARYVSGRLPFAKTVRMKLAGKRRTGPKGPGEWEPFELEHVGLGNDEQIVAFADWAIAQPEQRPPGNMVATGTLEVLGKSRPIAISLDRDVPENRALWRLEASELSMWMSVNHGAR